MASVAALRHRLDKMLIVVEQQQDASNDQRALALIQDRLFWSLSIISDTGSLPLDYETQLKQLDQETTPAERAIMERFAHRYHAEDVKRQLLSELEQQIIREEESL